MQCIQLWEQFVHQSSSHIGLGIGSIVLGMLFVWIGRVQAKMV